MTHIGLRPPLAISLLVHAAALALAAPFFFTAVAPGRQPTLQLTIAPVAQQDSALLKAPPVQPMPVEKPAERVQRSPAPVALHIAVTPEPSASSPPADRDAAARADESAAETPGPAVAADTTNGSSREEIMGRLDSALRTHFYYPPLARRKGWEGQVTVGIRVQPDGRLTDIRVIESSGHRILDSAAVDSLMRAARLRGVRHSIQAGMELVLPVKYLLIDSPA